MQVKILKGTNQIGGCITEITSDSKTKIIIDFGQDLSSEDDIETDKNPNIKGLTIGKPEYDAVFITHSHGDHIGLIHHILDSIPVYVEPISKKIYNLLSFFTHKKIKIKTNNMIINKKILINNDIKVTPFIVDHSSYNSVMLLIEADGKKVLHTGDFRNHGIKGNLFLKKLKEIGQVDLIIAEATTVNRQDKKYPKEIDLQKQAISIFKKYDQIFILTSSTNIDRITTFYKAATQTNKNFILDVFTANIVTNLNNNSIPNPKTFKNIYTWIPTKYKNKGINFKIKYIYPFLKYSKQKSYVNNKYLLMVKTSMLEDIKKLYKKKHITNACLIYSMWEGYKSQTLMNQFLEDIKKYGIKEIINLHTSGHADKEALRLLNILNAKKVIPIHTTAPDELSKILNNVYLPKEKEIIDI